MSEMLEPGTSSERTREKRLQKFQRGARGDLVNITLEEALSSPWDSTDPGPPGEAEEYSLAHELCANVFLM